MVSLEKKKMLQMHLENARRHAVTACRFEDTRLAARELKDSIAELTSAVQMLEEMLNDDHAIY